MPTPDDYKMMHEESLFARQWVRDLAIFFGCVGLMAVVLASAIVRFHGAGPATSPGELFMADGATGFHWFAELLKQ